MEGGTEGEEVDVGGGIEKNQKGVSGVEGIVGSGGVTEGGKGVGVDGVLGKGDSGVAPSGGWGVYMAGVVKLVDGRVT